MNLRRSPQEPIRVVVCDDQPEVRRALSRHFERDGRVTVVAQADDGERVLDVIVAAQPAVVVLDLAMPKMDGLRAIREIRAISPETKIVVLSSMVPFGDTSGQAEAEGADRIFSKYVKPKTLIKAILEVGISEEPAA